MKTLKLIAVGFLCFLGISSSAQLNVTIAGGDVSVCANDVIPLNAQVNSGSPTTYLWSSPGVTITNSGASSTSAVLTSSNYVYLRTSTATETFLDSIYVTVRLLPNIVVNNDLVCLPEIKNINMHDQFIIAPTNENLGTPSWSCVECYTYGIDSIVIDSGSFGIPDYYLNTAKIQYKTRLLYTFENTFGCVNSDTVVVDLRHTGDAFDFEGARDVCWNEGLVNLDSIFKPSSWITSGSWALQSDSNYRDTADFGGITNGRLFDASFAEVDYSIPNSTNKWKLRYTGYSAYTGNCPLVKDTVVHITYPPQLNLTDFTQPSFFCEDNADIPLEANPSGGTWTSSNSSALMSGNAFSPSNATVKGSEIWFYYNYTNPVTGCSNSDSIDAVVDPSPSFTIPNDTAFIRPLGQASTNLQYSITGENYSYLLWFASGFYGNSSQFSVTAGLAPGTVAINHSSNTDTFRVLVAAGGLGSCNDVDDFFDIIVNPNPASGGTDLVNEFLAVYPNPSTGLVHLENPKNYELKLVNSLGQEIRVTENQTKSFVIPQSGIYFIKAFDGNKLVAIEKIVVY